MVTPLQLAHVYATIGSYGLERPLSITRIDPPVMGHQVMPEDIVHQVEHMMESVALPGGGGIKAAVRDYRVAIKTGTAKKIGDQRSTKRELLRRGGLCTGLQPDYGGCFAH